MKLRTKLIITFLIPILVPVIFTSVGFLGVGRYQMREVQRLYEVEDVSYETLSNTILLLNRITGAPYSEMEQTAAAEPDAFEDPVYLENLNEELENRYSFLVVRKGDDYIYVGSIDTQEELLENLPDYGDFGSSQETGVYIGSGDLPFLVRQLNFLFSDGSEGSAFIVTAASAVIPEVGSLISQVGFILVIILILTGIILITWIYRSIVLPINHLRDATREIARGNLDFEMPAGGDDEIGELFNDFEEMRRKLKETSEEELVAEKENRELIGNISHDLKTPITAIQGYAEGLMEGVADTPQKREKYVRTIYNKANDMESLINELTFYSKIDTNRIPYTFEKINVSDFFSDCVEDLTMELEEHNIELSYSNEVEDDVQVIADAEQIKRVIDNIVNNSIKYIDKPRGYINIKVTDVGDFIQIDISDNGKGIAARDLPMVFDRFYRTDASRNSAQGGSGIGLSIVKKIIEDHGGKVWATSRENEGTEIHFVLRKYQELGGTGA